MNSKKLKKLNLNWNMLENYALDILSKVDALSRQQLDIYNRNKDKEKVDKVLLEGIVCGYATSLKEIVKNVKDTRITHMKNDKPLKGKITNKLDKKIAINTIENYHLIEIELTGMSRYALLELMSITRDKESISKITEEKEQPNGK